jgi:ABC-type nitrate/sulfonate/bicarbonate transport system substrate-binding protein
MWIKMRHLRNLSIVFLLFFVCALYQPALALQNVTLKLQWLDQFQFAGYYIAKEKGFYSEAGLDVTILPFTSEGGNVVEQVLSGQATYGTGRSSLVVERFQGKPVVVMAAIFQEAPTILLTLKESGITRVSELVGRRVMINLDELDSAAALGMLAAEGVRPFDVIHQKHSYNLDDLITSKTDAMAAYVSNEPYILEERAIEYKSFAPKDYGQSHYGDLLFTSQKEITENPQRAKAFHQASLRGWAYAFAHIEETAQLIKKRYNSQDKSLKSLIFEGKVLKKMAYKEGIPLGHVSQKRFEKLAHLYYNLGILGQMGDLSGFVWRDGRSLRAAK